MKTRFFLAAGAAAMLLSTAAAAQVQPGPPNPGPGIPPAMPTARTTTGKHVNRVIDMWLKGQPVYYATVSGGGYEDGKRMAATKADYIAYDLEHAPLDFRRLRDFMQGLKDAGPTRTGHVTPAVIVTLPIPGTADALRANGWMIQQALAQGIHGILLCNAESPEAVKMMVEAARYPFAPVAPGLTQGTRGNGSQGQAAPMWGMTAAEYVKVSDVWPLNPDGNILLGVKIENPRADVMVESTLRVPGVSFAEWGPGDNGFYLLGPPGSGSVNDPKMVALRARVLAAAKATNVKFLNACSPENVVEQIKDGTMICTGGDTTAPDIGRAFSKRTDPF